MEYKRKVLFLAEELRVGGAETYCYRIENFINRDLVDFYLAAVNGKCYDKVKHKDKYFEYEKSFRSKYKVIKDLVKSKNVDVIHANSLRLAIIAYIIKKMNKENFKLIYTKHNLTFLEKIHIKLFTVFVNNCIDKLVTVCEYDRKYFMNNGINENKIINVYNSIDVDIFKYKPHLSKNENLMKICMMSRLSEEKNHMMFLQIIEQLKERNMKCEYYIAGDGDERQNIESEIVNRGLIDDITMVGNANSPEKFLSEMDVILLLSTREVFPMTLLEAMSVGCYVISVDVGGVSDCVFDGRTGTLIDDYDVRKYVNEIEAINSSKSSYLERIKNARKMTEETFDLKNMLNKICDIYYWRI